MDRFRSLSTLVMAVALTGLLAACNSGTEEPKAPAAPSTSSSSSQGGTDSTAAAGDAASARPRSGDRPDSSRFPKELPDGVEASIPHNFPADLPIYPGSEPAQGRGVELDGVAMSAVQLVTLDSPEQAFAFYKDKLESDGWTIENSQVGENASLSAAKGDRKVSFLIAPSEDGGADIYVITQG